MKYAEYLAPEMVSKLISLHSNIKDVLSFMRQHDKIDRFKEDSEYYLKLSEKGGASKLKNIIEIINYLKKRVILNLQSKSFI